MLLEQYIQILKDKAAYADKQTDTVSAKGVDWHIDHSCRAIIVINKALQNSDPDKYVGSIHPKIVAFFELGVLPRGKAQAPKEIVAKNAITQESLEQLLEAAKKALSLMVSLPKNSHFNHPVFGILPLDMTIRFLEIHTKHHLKIIDDIIAVLQSENT